MTMQTDIPVAVSEGVTNLAFDSAVSETFEKYGFVASPKVRVCSWPKSRVVSLGEKAGFNPFVFSSLERVERGAM